VVSMQLIIFKHGTTNRHVDLEVTYQGVIYAVPKSQFITTFEAPPSPPASGLLINLSISSESIFAIDSREIQRFDADTNEWNTPNANELVYSDATHATYYANEYGQSYQFRLLEKHVDATIPDIASDTLTATTDTIGSDATSYDLTTQNFELATPDSNFTIVADYGSIELKVGGSVDSNGIHWDQIILKGSDGITPIEYDVNVNSDLSVSGDPDVLEPSYPNNPIHYAGSHLVTGSSSTTRGTINFNRSTPLGSTLMTLFPKGQVASMQLTPYKTDGTRRVDLEITYNGAIYNTPKTTLTTTFVAQEAPLVTVTNITTATLDIGSLWLEDRDDTYNTVPAEFVGAIKTEYTQGAVYDDVTIQFNRPTEVLAWQYSGDNPANPDLFSQAVEDDLLSVNRGFAISSYVLTFTGNHPFTTYTKQYAAGDTLQFDTLHIDTHSVAYLFLAFREAPLVTVTNITTATFEVGSKRNENRTDVYDVVPAEFVGALKTVHNLGDVYNIVTIQFHRPTEVLAWLDNWEDGVVFDHAVEDDLLNNRGFAISSHELRMNNGYGFATYSKQYNAGETVTFDTLNTVTSTGAFLFLAFRELPEDVNANGLIQGTTGTNNYILSKKLLEFPIYIECEIKSTTESVGLYLTTSDSQLSDTPFTKTLFWGTGKTNVSRYDWGIYDVSNTSYNGIAYNDQYDSLAETFQKFAVYCDDKRAHFYKDNLLMYQFSRTEYPDFWTHVEESTHGLKFGVFSASAEMKNFKTSPNLFAPGTYDIQTVSYTTTFDAQWNEMNSIEQREFEDQFKAVSAESLGVPIDNVIIHSVTQGSVIVKASVYVTTDTGITTTDVMNTLSDTSIYTGGVLGDTPPTISSIVTGLSSVIGELPKTPASPPTVTKGEITLNTIQIEWTPESNGDAKLIKYAVLVDNVIVDDTISATANSYTITSLEPNTDYTIIVRKVTSLGNSDSSGVFDITRNVYIAGNNDQLGTESSTFELTTFFGVDVDKVYGTGHDWAIVKTLGGVYYSVGPGKSYYHGRLGNVTSVQEGYSAVYNDHLNNHNQDNIHDPTKQIKSIGLLENGVVALLENGQVWHYGEGGRGMKYKYSRPSFSEFILDDGGESPYKSYLDIGWVIKNVYGYEDSIVAHLVRGNEHKVTFIGRNTQQFGFDENIIDFNGINSTSDKIVRENTKLNELLIGKSVIEIHTTSRLLRINIDGVWYGLGTHQFCSSYPITDTRYSDSASNWTGRIWTAEDIATLWYSSSYPATDIVELEYLNSFLASLPSDSYLVESKHYSTCIYTPSTGKFHIMSPQSSYGAWGNNTVSWIQTRTSFVEIPEMNLNNIGNANDLANLTGTFVSYHHLSNIGLFVTQTSTGFETVKTLILPSAPIIQTIESPTETSRDITWTPEDHGDAVVEKYAILLDGVIIQDDISKDTFTWSLTNIGTDTSNQSFNVRKFTNLGNIDSTPIELFSLRVHYDFATDTLDEQVTGNPEYTLTKQVGASYFDYDFVSLYGSRWLHTDSKNLLLVSPIGDLLPTRNFTWMIRYYTPNPDHESAAARVNLSISFGTVPTSEEACDTIVLHQRLLLAEPNYWSPVYFEVNTATNSKPFGNREVHTPHKDTLHLDGSTIDANRDFGYEHVFIGVCNINQTDGTDLAAQPGTIACYIDNKLITTANITDNDFDAFNFNSLKHFQLMSNRGGPESQYINSIKIYNGVVDMNTLNSLPCTLFSHTWTTGLSAKSYVSDRETYDVGDVIDLDIITEGPTDHSFEVEFSIGLTSSPNGSDASEYPQGSYNYSWYMLHRNNGWQVYRGDQLSGDRYYKSKIGPGYPDELYTQFINHYLRMTIISDSQVEYKYYTDSSRTTLHALDPVRIITQQFSLPAYVFFGPEATESYGCNRAGNSIFVFKPETKSE